MTLVALTCAFQRAITKNWIKGILIPSVDISSFGCPPLGSSMRPWLFHKFTYRFPDSQSRALYVSLYLTMFQALIIFYPQKLSQNTCILLPCRPRCSGGRSLVCCAEVQSLLHSGVYLSYFSSSNWFRYDGALLQYQNIILDFWHVTYFGPQEIQVETTLSSIIGS